MVKCRDLKNINIHKNTYNPKIKYTSKKKIVGLDTETEKGKVFILGVYENKIKKTYRINHFDDFLKVIKKLPVKGLLFFYNISYDFQAIIKLLSIEDIKFISVYEFLDTDDYYLKYIPNKCIQIKFKKEKQEYIFYDLAQFYSHQKLDNAGEKYFNIRKENIKKYNIDISKLSTKRYDEDKYYKEILDKYLIRDCKITYLLGKKLRDLCIEKLDLYPKTLYSQASIFQQKFTESINRKYELPDKEILQFALNNYNGGRFEAIKRGYFKDCKIMDINSAYPEQMYKLPALDKGKWIKNKKYEKDSLISLFYVSFELPDMIISPMRCDTHKKIKGLFYPVGNFNKVYINKKEYEIIKEYCKVKIHDVWHYFDDNPEYLFYFIKNHYEERVIMKKEKDDGQLIIKIEINGGYGKTIQLIPDILDIEINKDEVEKVDKKFKGKIEDIYIHNGKLFYRVKEKFKSGILFNPIYANEITANTRCKLFNSIKDNMDDVIAFATDSIIYQGDKINKKLTMSKDKLGDWDCEYKGDIVFIGCGVYHLVGKEKSKLRGFDTKYNLYELLKKNRNNKFIQLETQKVIKMKYLNKLKDLKDMPNKDDKYDNLNQFAGFIKKINLNFDKKRIWEKDFKNCGDVIDTKTKSKCIRI